LTKLTSSNFKNKLKKVKQNNKRNLCRYFTLLYPEDYASDLVGQKCDNA